MEDNKNPKGAARSAAPLGRRRRRRLVVFHLVRISYVFGAFPGPCWTPTGPPTPYGNYGPRGNYAPHLYSGYYSSRNDGNAPGLLPVCAKKEAPPVEKGWKKKSETGQKSRFNIFCGFSFLFSETSARVSETGFSTQKELKMRRNGSNMFFL